MKKKTGNDLLELLKFIGILALIVLALSSCIKKEEQKAEVRERERYQEEMEARSAIGEWILDECWAPEDVRKEYEAGELSDEDLLWLYEKLYGNVLELVKNPESFD